MRILLIEGNATDTALVRALLREGLPGGVVHAVAHLDEALAVLGRERFDVALLDPALSDSQELEPLIRLRERAPRLPIVMLSGRDDEEFALAAAAAGAQDYLRKKEMSDAVLARVLRYAVERARLAERLATSVAELQEHRAEVIHLNQLKNDLISLLAHDYKGPLTTIGGFAELLEEGALEEQEVRDAAATIRRNVERLTTLTNDSLALSRVEHGELELASESVDLCELLADVVAAISPAADVRIECRAGDGVIIGDAMWLRQVFDNLVRNAIKYSPAQEPIDVRLVDLGEAVRVEIIDHGIGIPPAELPLLFQRFSRASNAKRSKISGSGLGLFLAKTLVERHGGRIDVRSTLDEGSTFGVTLFRRPPVLLDARCIGIAIANPTLRAFAAYELRAHGMRVQTIASLEMLGCTPPVDVLLVEVPAIAVNAAEVRVASQRTSILVGLGGSADQGWDAVLPLPFLSKELFATLQSVDERATHSASGIGQ
ncbi:MAG: sensor histidine kinase [Vulcanimicrobiaceae bacterium]